MACRVWSAIVCALLSLALSGCFPQRAGWRLAHFENESPSAGTAAPRPVLYDSNGQMVDLGDLLGQQPLVVQFGSHSCPVYRYRRFGMNKLYEEFQGRAKFVLIYTREAHPLGSKSPYDDEQWLTAWNRVSRVLIAEPTSREQRIDRARWSVNTLGIRYPLLVDAMNNAGWRAYGRAASPAFVIDVDGQIVLRQVWVDPGGIRDALSALLAEDGVEARQNAGSEGVYGSE